jgi:hypothetical protein
MTSADILNRAADLIEERGWFQYTKDGSSRSLCVNFAIIDAAAVVDPLLAAPARRLFLQHLGLQPVVPTDGLEPTDFEQVVEWNDDPVRTQAQVIAALRAAALERIDA